MNKWKIPYVLDHTLIGLVGLYFSHWIWILTHLGGHDVHVSTCSLGALFFFSFFSFFYILKNLEKFKEK